ncbi:hypothetical protein KAW48_09275 [candidate division WOR-3 bacterium]|nr:hypothetical protein [candidate division WOR-3 bacterium]
MFIILLFLELSPGIDSIIERAIELSFQEEFTQSESLLIAVAGEIPGHPAPYFSLLSLYELMWVDMGIDSFSEKFFAYSDSCIRIGSEWLNKNPEDAWGYFFLGGTYTLLTFYYALKGDIIKGIAFVGPALKWLSKCRSTDPSIIDVYLGLGGWEYFKGNLPFLSSRKEKGLSMIKRAAKDAKYVSTFATLAYAEILLREKRYDESISILLPLLDSFPDSRTLNWPLLKCYYEKKDYKNALRIAERLIALSSDNNYSLFESLYYKTRILIHLRRLKPARDVCKRALSIKVDIEAPDVKGEKKELRKLLQKILQGLGE